MLIEHVCYELDFTNSDHSYFLAFKSILNSNEQSVKKYNSIHMNSHYLEIYFSHKKCRLLPMLLSPNNKKNVS
jgi:hypothetical protein